DRHALIGHLDGDLDDAAMLFVADGGAFAGGANGHQTMAALLDLPFDKAGEGFLIDDPVAHGSDERRYRSSQHLSQIPQLGVPRSCRSRWFEPAIPSVF